MKVFDRITGLRMWQKLAVIVIALGLPAITLAVFYIGSMSYDGKFAQAELDGLEFIEPVDKLCAYFNTDRGMNEASLRFGATVGHEFKPKIEENRAKIEEAIRPTKPTRSSARSSAPRRSGRK
jgi:hypothetical protein